VYRIVRTDPPEPADFERPVDLPSGRRRRNCCKAYGLSVFTSMTDAQRAVDATPGVKGRLIAEGVLGPSLGVTTPTPTGETPTPCTRWVPSVVAVAHRFTVVE